MTTAGGSSSSLSKAMASCTGLMQAASHLLQRVVSEICQNMFGAVQAQALSDGCGSVLFKHNVRQYQGANSTWCKACNLPCNIECMLLFSEQCTVPKHQHERMQVHAAPHLGRPASD